MSEELSEPWVAVKFGGTSVSSAFSWRQIADHIKHLRSKNKRVWVVISAVTQVSNHLEKCVEEAINAGEGESASKFPSFEFIRKAHYKLAEDAGLSPESLSPLNRLFDELGKILEGVSLLQEASPRVRARVMAQGELASTLLGIPILKAMGVDDVIRIDARDLLQTTPRPNEQEADRYLEGLVLPSRNPVACERLSGTHPVVLTQGFIARTPRGETCILGRGGSDTSASLFGALLGAEAVEIWTDVHGMFTTDPRDEPAARLIHKISYREAEELAAMGAKVLHPRCIGPCQWASIPLLIKNTWDPHAQGTHIVSSKLSLSSSSFASLTSTPPPSTPGETTGDANPSVMAVIRRVGQTLISLSTLEMWGASGFLAKAFAPFEQLGISIDLVGTSQSTVTITMDRIPGGVAGEPFQALLARLRALGQVEVVHPCAVVSIVGRRIRHVLHEMGPALKAFKDHQIHLVSESSENLNLSFVVEQDVATTLVVALHNALVPREGKDELFGPTWADIKA
eukprot:TRINITY_DN11239_c0_g1_i2.p1 TRINITY_DN11239_c0_g1~~TRINITY_DN11239_c0_g1_i2.p1  ORF type:complete len:512 (-),score=133.23 TRINITY_DN11239_c0_g1_i2:137-1672(-)